MQNRFYIKLFHGRETPEEDMNDWGFDGPIIGPIGLSITYHGLKIHDTDYCSHEELPFIECLVSYEGKFYGDVDFYCSDDPLLQLALKQDGQQIHDYATFVKNLKQ